MSGVDAEVDFRRRFDLTGSSSSWSSSMSPSLPFSASSIFRIGRGDASSSRFDENGVVEGERERDFGDGRLGVTVAAPSSISIRSSAPSSCLTGAVVPFAADGVERGGRLAVASSNRFRLLSPSSWCAAIGFAGSAEDVLVAMVGGVDRSGRGEGFGGSEREGEINEATASGLAGSACTRGCCCCDEVTPVVAASIDSLGRGFGGSWAIVSNRFCDSIVRGGRATATGRIVRDACETMRRPEL